MPSAYTGDPSTFHDSIDLMIGSDPKTAQIFREPHERTIDNLAFLRQQTEAAQMRLALALRLRGTTFSATEDEMAAVELIASENAAGPVLAIKPGQAAQAVYDFDDTADYPGGNVPSLGLVSDAAVDASGRIVIVGSNLPYNAYLAPGGSWTSGGNQPGGSLSQVIYAPDYGGFMALRTTNVWRSTNGVAWAATPVGLAEVGAIAAVGAGPGAGRILALAGAAITPDFAVSVNNGASFSGAGGNVPYAADTQESGSLAGCPLVSRLGLNEYVYHCARCNSGTEIRTARTRDGVTWEEGPTITASAGRTFQAPTLKICKSTGLMVITTRTTVTASGHAYRELYASLDFTRWIGVATTLSTFQAAAFAVAGGRLLFTAGATLAASDGISHEVYE